MRSQQWYTYTSKIYVPRYQIFLYTYIMGIEKNIIYGYQKKNTWVSENNIHRYQKKYTHVYQEKIYLQHGYKNVHLFQDF